MYTSSKTSKYLNISKRFKGKPCQPQSFLNRDAQLNYLTTYYAKMFITTYFHIKYLLNFRFFKVRLTQRYHKLEDVEVVCQLQNIGTGHMWVLSHYQQTP